MRRRTLHWDAIPDGQINATVWGSANTSQAHDAIDTHLLDALFQKVQTPAKAKKTRSRTPAEEAKAKEEVVVTLLELKRATNVEIMLSQMTDADGQRVSCAAVAAAIGSLDTSFLTEEHIEQLLKNAPLPEEFEAVRAYRRAGRPAAALGRAEQFVTHLLDVPRVEKKLAAMQIKLVFGEAGAELNRKYKTILEAAGLAASSAQLKKLLETVLAVGNTLNSGRRRVRGFRLGSLSKLVETKSFDGKTTLLHYLVAILEMAGDPAGLLDLKGALRPVYASKRLEFGPIDADLAELGKGMRFLEEEIAAASEGGAEGGDSEYLAELKEFYGASTQILAEMHQLSRRAHEAFVHMALFFGESRKDLDKAGSQPAGLVAQLCDFVDAVYRAKGERSKVEACRAAAKLIVEAGREQQQGGAAGP